MSTATNGHIRRFRRGFPCPVCGGSDDEHRGQGSRCFGFLSSDGRYAHCTREDHANGDLEYSAESQSWAHRVGGPCNCGREHGPPQLAPRRRIHKPPTIDTTYDYHDAQGHLLFQVVRFRNPKGFRQRRRDTNAKGGWSWSLKGITPVLYRLPALLAADPSETVFIVEGEKDANRLASFGLVATCNSMGAGKWRDHYAESLRDRRVAILPDNDQVGRDHAEAVARSLAGKAVQTKIVELPDLPEKGDVSDWLDHGHSIGQLRELVDQAPTWEPPQVEVMEFPLEGGNGPPAEGEPPSRPVGGELVFANFHQDDSEGDKPRRTAQRMYQLEARLREIVGDWPKCVGRERTLFLQGADHQPVYLDTSTRLFAWIDSKAQVDWARGGRMIPQERFYEHLRMNSPGFEAIETLPHWPELPGIYYMHPPVTPKAENGALNELLSLFTPESPEDRELIRAFILTLFCGVTPGSRPAFLITGSDQDPEQGRGIGKSKLVDMVAELVNGSIDVCPTDPIAEVKTRLLSDEARQTRLAKLDNVKTLKFSWADLEGLITATTISGRMLYKGEGRRPNTITWAITLNGASLSKDMAQRVVVIKLRRPEYRPTWEDDVRAFIQARRREILEDVRYYLEGPRALIEARSRWAAWERDVLARCALTNLCQDVIAKRQGECDDDNQEREIVRGQFREEIELRHRDPDESTLFITSKQTAQWVEAATGEKRATNKATTFLKGLGIAELSQSKKNGKLGWVWRGKDANPQAPADWIDPPLGAGARAGARADTFGSDERYF